MDAQELESILETLQKNKSKLHEQVDSLELLLQKLIALLDELMSQELPPQIKYSFRRITIIDTLSNSISKISEQVRKLREDIHTFTIERVQLELEETLHELDTLRSLDEVWLKIAEKNT